MHEILAHRAACIRRDILQGARFGSGCRNNDGIIHSAGILQFIHKSGNRRSLLSDSDIDTDYILPLLVDNGIDSNRCLTGLSVADNQLSLSPSDRNHGVNGFDSSLQRLFNRLSFDNAGCRTFYSTELRALNGACSINRLSDGIHYSTNQRLANRYRNNSSCTLYTLSFLDSHIGTEKDSGNTGFFQVLRHTESTVTKLQKLTRHTVCKAGNSGNTVTNRKDGAGFILYDSILVIFNLASNDLGYFFWF